MLTFRLCVSPCVVSSRFLSSRFTRTFTANIVSSCQQSTPLVFPFTRTATQNSRHLARNRFSFRRFSVRCNAKSRRNRLPTSFISLASVTLVVSRRNASSLSLCETDTVTGNCASTPTLPLREICTATSPFANREWPLYQNRFVSARHIATTSCPTTSYPTTSSHARTFAGLMKNRKGEKIARRPARDVIKSADGRKLAA
jgi:hypothetical protein